MSDVHAVAARLAALQRQRTEVLAEEEHLQNELVRMLRQELMKTSVELEQTKLQLNKAHEDLEFLAPVEEGFDEVGARFEADFVKRHRCARNHVRRLLRGRGWYEAQLLVVKEDKKAKRKAMRAAKVQDEEAAKKAADGGGEEGGGGSHVLAIQEERFMKLKIQKNRRRPLEGAESFFYPQRLMMACALSCWICTMR